MKPTKEDSLRALQNPSKLSKPDLKMHIENLKDEFAFTNMHAKNIYNNLTEDDNQEDPRYVN